MDTKALRGIGLMVGAMYSLDLFSAFMSSPWSTEAFGADATRAASARRLVAISATTGVTVGAVASWLDRSWWPLVGTAGAAAFMVYLYEAALQRGQTNGYTGVDLAAGTGTGTPTGQAA